MGSIANVPETIILDNSSYNLLNAVRENTTDFFKSMTPFVKDDQTFKAYGQYVTGPGLNEFVTALGGVFTTIITTRNFENIYKKYKAGIMEFGDSIRELFNNLPTPQGYSLKTNNAGEVFAYSNPGTEVVYHPVNCRMFVKTSVSDSEIKECFKDMSAFSNFAENQVRKLYDKYEQVEFYLVRYTMCRAALDNWNTNRIALEKGLDHNKASSQYVLTEMQTVSDNLVKPDIKYTALHNVMHTTKDRQLFWLTPESKSQIGVYAMAEAFNLTYDEFAAATDTMFVNWSDYEIEELNHIGSELVANGYMPNFAPFTAEERAKLASIVGIIVDKEFFKIYDTDLHVEAIRNPERLFTNYYLHFARIFSYSPFVNMVIFTAPPEIKTVDTQPMDPDEEIFGYTVNNLQNDIIVTDDAISGNLMYQTEGSLVDRWGAGNFIALKFANIDPNATSVKVGMSPSVSSGLVEILDDPDKNGAFKVTSTDHKFVVMTKTANGTKIQTYDLTGLSLAIS